MKQDQGHCADCSEHDFIQPSHEGDRLVCSKCFEKYAPQEGVWIPDNGPGSFNGARFHPTPKGGTRP